MSTNPDKALSDAETEIAATEHLLEVAAAAKRLKKCPETIRRYIRRGLLPARRLPGGTRRGTYLIAESALNAFIVPN